MARSMILWSFLVLSCSVRAQVVFNHLTNPSNTNRHITKLDHAQLNGNPGAVVFASPVKSQKEDQDEVNSFGVYYDGWRWTIFNQNLEPVPNSASRRLRFNVLFFPKPNSKAFVHTVSAANRSKHITTLDHPLLNGKPNAVLIVTQRYNGVYNKHEIGVWYNGGRWKIFNQDLAEMPVKAQFNVLVADGGAGIAGATAIQHTHTSASRVAMKPAYSVLDHASLNKVPGLSLFVTQRWIGTYNDKVINVMFDSPGDDFRNLSENRWLIYNPQNQAMPTKAAFNILAVSQIKFFLPLAGDLSLDPFFFKPKLHGWVDMHTHPMARWAFGEQLFYGEIDGNPAVGLGSCSCIHNYVAWPFDGNCGEQNIYRNSLVDEMDKKWEAPVHAKVEGFPNFRAWPRYNSVLHQQMWVDWIRRAYEGGLRVMVALAVNNQCLADAAETSGPNDDLRSMNTQIQKMKEFVNRHNSFMEIALSGADLRRIAGAGKLAIVLGVEMDNIGNFYNPADRKGGTFIPHPTQAQVRNEINRLYNLGVRYIFPIHLTNNVFGGSAIYEQGFNVTNKYNTGSAFNVESVNSSTGITFKLLNPYQAIDDLGVFAMNFTGTIIPGNIMPNNRANYPEYPDPGLSKGHRNSLGLTNLGRFAVRYMMQKGMLIDIDHCSEKATEDILAIARTEGYPVNSGHNGPRGNNGNENGRTDAQYQAIQSLGGMIGLGHGGNANDFLAAYRHTLRLTGNRQIGIGTDANGLYPLPGPPPPNAHITYGGDLTQCVMGSKTWDFNTEGVAHYGLMPDYIKSWEVAGMTPAGKEVFFSSAEYFAQMWEKCDSLKR